MSEGKVMAAMSEKILKPPLVEILELLAARHAVVFTVETGFHQVVIEESLFVAAAMAYKIFFFLFSWDPSSERTNLKK